MSDKSSPRWEQPDETTVALWRTQARAKALVAQWTALGHAVGQNGAVALVAAAASVPMHRPVLGLAIAVGLTLRGAWQAGLALGERAEAAHAMAGAAVDGQSAPFHARHRRDIQRATRKASVHGAAAGFLEGARGPAIAAVAVQTSPEMAAVAFAAAAVTFPGSVDAVHARLDRDFETLASRPSPYRPHAARIPALRNIARRKGWDAPGGLPNGL